VFDRWLVHAPLVCFLLLNLAGLVLSQVLCGQLEVALMPTPAPPKATGLEADNNPFEWDVPRRRLQEEAKLFKDFQAHFPHVSFSMQDAGDSHEVPGQAAAELTLASKAVVVLLPWLVQLLLAWLEVVAGLYFTRSSHFLAVVSSVTADIEKGCNAWLDKQGKGMSTEVFATFRKVQEQSDRFFPAVRLRLGQLRSHLLAGGKADANNGLLGRALFPVAGA